MKLASCHPSGDSNFEVFPVFLEIFYLVYEIVTFVKLTVSK